MDHWYVIKTKPRKEDDVSTFFANANLEVFLPKIRERFYASTAPVYRVKPLFPSYLFLRIDFQKGENIHRIKYTRGVSKILCAENRPVPLDEEMIRAIRSRLNGDGLIDCHLKISEGERIRVRRGFLKDLEGILVKRVSDNERVIVLLNHISAKVSATLHWTEIEKLH